jgi:hypothetical protein
LKTEDLGFLGGDDGGGLVFGSGGRRRLRFEAGELGGENIDLGVEG